MRGAVALSPARVPLRCSSFSVMAWSLVGVATHLSPSLTGKLFWTNAQYVWVALVLFFWLLFVLVYTGHERLLTLRNVAALSIHPVMLQVLVWANPAGLFRKAVWLESCGAYHHGQRVRPAVLGTCGLLLCPAPGRVSFAATCPLRFVQDL